MAPKQQLGWGLTREQGHLLYNKEPLTRAGREGTGGDCPSYQQLCRAVVLKDAFLMHLKQDSTKGPLGVVFPKRIYFLRETPCCPGDPGQGLRGRKGKGQRPWRPCDPALRALPAWPRRGTFNI